MTHLFHLYRHSQNNFFFENRFAYAGEATPSPDIADGEILAAGIEGSVKGGIDLKTHHFDDAKIKALNLLADVDKVVPDKDPLRPQAEKLKAELANHPTEGIHAKFDALHTEYDIKLNNAVNGIAALGPTHPEAERIRVEYRAKANDLIAKVQARVAEPEVKDYVTHHAGMEALTAVASSTPEARIAARTKVLESMFKALQIPDGARGIARYMAEAMEGRGEYNIPPNMNVAQAREWFKRQLEDTKLIQRSMEQLANRAASGFEATDTEISMFTDLFNKKPDGTTTNKNSEKLGFTFGLPNVPQAAEALAWRFRTVTTQGAEGPQTYYVDLKDPNKTVYTAETLKPKLLEIVTKEMSTGEAVNTQLAEMLTKAEEVQAARAEVADTGLWGGFWNDMIDSLGELKGEEDAAKLKHLELLLNLTNPAQDSVATFDKAERGKLATVAREKGEAEQKAADRQHQVDTYFTARTDLVALTLADGAQLVPKTKEAKDLKPGDTDVIEIKNKEGNQVLARIETKLEAPHKPRLSVLGTDGKEVFGKPFDSVADLGLYLLGHTDVTKIIPELVTANKARVEAVRAALWPLGKSPGKGRLGPEQLQLGKGGLSMEASAAVLGRIGPDDPLVVTIALSKGKDQVGHIQVEFPASVDPTAQIMILGKGVAANLNVGQVREDLTKNGEKYLTEAKVEAELAAKNKAGVDAVFAAIKFPEASPGQVLWKLENETQPNSFTAADAFVTKDLKHAISGVVATVQVNVVSPHALTLTPKAGELGTEPIPLTPDKFQQFLKDNILKLKPAPAATVAAVPGAAPEATTVRKDLLPARANLVTVLQSRYPHLFGGDAINKPETAAAIDGILTRLGDNRERIQVLTEGRFIPSDAEARIIIEEFDKANGFGETDRAIDPKEIGFINGLQTSGGATFESVFGKDSALAKALSKQYTIKAGEKSGIIINDGQKDHVVLNLNQLAFRLPQADRQAFETAINPNVAEPAKKAALEAVATSAGDREKAMDQVRAVREALRGDKAKEVFGKMGLGELIASITQIWKAIQEGMKTGDFSVANDVLSLLNNKRNPAEIMNKNQRRFADILRDAQPKDIGQLLGAYLSPKGAEAGEVFGEANAKTAGLDADAIKDLAFFRTEMKPAIAKYLTSQFGLDKIASIENDDINGVIKVVGNRGGEKYEMEFFTGADNKLATRIFKFHNQPKADEPTKTESVRDENAIGPEIAAVNFTNIHEVFTGKKPPETRTAEAPGAPPPKAEAPAPTAADLGWKSDPPPTKEQAQKAILAKAKKDKVDGKVLLAQLGKDAETAKIKPKDIPQWRLKWLVDHEVPKVA